ncbi:MAG: hypothetical protein ACO1OQ_02950 [Rufibacter sp.]
MVLGNVRLLLRTELAAAPLHTGWATNFPIGDTFRSWLYRIKLISKIGLAETVGVDIHRSSGCYEVI